MQILKFCLFVITMTISACGIKGLSLGVDFDQQKIGIQLDYGAEKARDVLETARRTENGQLNEFEFEETYLAVAEEDDSTAAPSTTLKVATPLGVETTFAVSVEQSEAVDIVVKVALENHIDPLDFLTVAKLESNLKPNAANPRSTAKGLFQFLIATGLAYNLTDPFDAEANARAAARLWKDNMAYLRKKLGREPTGAEIYLAHQQGMGGAAKLILGGNSPAAAITGNSAIGLNLPKGSPKNPSAAEFVAIWQNKFATARSLFSLTD